VRGVRKALKTQEVMLSFLNVFAFLVPPNVPTVLADACPALSSSLTLIGDGLLIILARSTLVATPVCCLISSFSSNSFDLELAERFSVAGRSMRMFAQHMNILTDLMKNVNDDLLSAAHSVLIANQRDQLTSSFPDETRRASVLEWATSIYQAHDTLGENGEGRDLLSSGIGRLVPGGVWFSGGAFFFLFNSSRFFTIF
jgi:hypothetical protein